MLGDGHAMSILLSLLFMLDPFSALCSGRPSGRPSNGLKPVAYNETKITGVQAAPPSEGALSGQVVADGTNAPVADARIVVFPAAPRSGPFGGPPPQAMTDAQGRFTVSRLAPGSYRIDVQKTGFAPLNDMTQRGPTADVTAGQTTSVLLRLHKGAVIAGRILDAAGEPISDVQVVAMRRFAGPSNGLSGPAPRLIPAGQGQQTNDIGEFRVSGLAAGEYYLAASPRSAMPFGGPGASSPAASAAGGITLATTYYPGTLDSAAAMPIAVAAGETASSIVMTMQSAPAFRLSGIVVDENGEPVGGAMVMLLPDIRNGAFFGPRGGAQTEANGRFTITNVTAGTYRLNASVPMRMDASGGTSWSSGSGGIGAVTAVGGGTTASSTTWSINGGPAQQPIDVVVADANVTGLRVVVQRR
jgi:carboxypeptidase family protein